MLSSLVKIPLCTLLLSDEDGEIILQGLERYLGMVSHFHTPASTLHTSLCTSKVPKLLLFSDEIQANSSCTIIVDWEALCNKPISSKDQTFFSKESDGEKHWGV